MAAKKRKTIRSTARKAVKKPTARMQKKPMKTKSSKVKMSPKKSTSVKAVRSTVPSNVDKTYTKGQLFTTLASCTGISRKDVVGCFDALGDIVAAHLKKQGPGQFTLPGLVKITVVHKPATKARKGKNPFTGEEMMFKAKPARNVVKVRALKALKGLV